MTDATHDCADHLQPMERDRDVPIHGTTVRVREALYRCAVCGEEEYTLEQATAAERRAGEVYRAENGFLQPDEIVGLRRRWGITQAQLEDALGVGKKTVARWEAGRVLQSRALDNLLRAIDRFPPVLGYLAERQGAEVHPDPAWAGDGSAPEPLAIPTALLSRLRRDAESEGVPLDAHAASIITRGLDRRALAREMAEMNRKLDALLLAGAE